MLKPSRLIVVFAVFSLLSIACSVDDEGGAGSSPAQIPEGGDEAVACMSGETDGDLHLYNWTEYIDPELVVAFEKEFSVDVVEDFYDSNQMMLAKLQSGAVYDLIVPSDYMVEFMIEEGILAEVQRDAVPNLDNLDSGFGDPAYDPGGVYSVAYQWGTTGIAVNVNVFGEDFEPTWGLVFDLEMIGDYPGGVSLLNDSRETMGAALKYLGYSLNSTSERELAEAANVISTAKRYVVQFDSDSYAQALVGGDVEVAHGYSGNFFSAFDERDESETYRFVIPVEGATMWVDNMSIPVAAKHPCTAHAFINFILDAENGAALTNWSYYASPNLASEAFINPAILENEVIYPSDELTLRLEVITDTGEFEVRYLEYFVAAMR